MAEMQIIVQCNKPEGGPEPLLPVLLLGVGAKHLVADALLEGAAAAKAEAGQDKEKHKKPELPKSQLASTRLPLVVEDVC